MLPVETFRTFRSPLLDTPDVATTVTGLTRLLTGSSGQKPSPSLILTRPVARGSLQKSVPPAGTQTIGRC
jgi:hypothetical protein